jgi:hypothetical protein
MKKSPLLSVIFLFAFLNISFATHNHAGLITYKQLDDYTIEASIITYTQIGPAQSDSLLIDWGDGSYEEVLRVNGPDNNMNGIPDGEPLDSFFQVNIYTAQHTFDELGQYTLSMTDPNRNGGILNVNFPNSDMVPFHIETEFKLIPLSNGETNQSPVILEPPIIRAFIGLPYIYTPNAFDIDGDSIIYQRTVPLQDDGTPVPNYQWPEEMNTNPPGQNIITLDMKKGLFYWDSPQVPGEYVIAFLIKSYHEGELIDQIVLDFTILVEDDPDFIPTIEIENISANQLIPVNVGDTMHLQIAASDPDVSQEIEITSSSGLYDYFDNPATFEAVSNGNTGTATFEWIVLEEHVRQQPYQVVIKVVDDDSLYSKTSLVVVCYQFEEFITGIKNPEKKIDFQLFPNPSTIGFVNLSFDNYASHFNHFKIYNSLGQLVKTSKISSDLTQIDVHFLDAGVYFLQVGTDKNTSVKSFIIQ